jgi:hypothetical protein
MDEATNQQEQNISPTLWQTKTKTPGDQAATTAVLLDTLHTPNRLVLFGSTKVGPCVYSRSVIHSPLKVSQSGETRAGNAQGVKTGPPGPLCKALLCVRRQQAPTYTTDGSCDKVHECSLVLLL